MKKKTTTCARRLLLKKITLKNLAAITGGNAGNTTVSTCDPSMDRTCLPTGLCR
jgi:hypothetical protein